MTRGRRQVTNGPIYNDEHCDGDLHPGRTPGIGQREKGKPSQKAS